MVVWILLSYIAMLVIAGAFGALQSPGGYALWIGLGLALLGMLGATAHLLHRTGEPTEPKGPF